MSRLLLLPAAAFPETAVPALADVKSSPTCTAGAPLFPAGSRVRHRVLDVMGTVVAPCGSDRVTVHYDDVDDSYQTIASKLEIA